MAKRRREALNERLKISGVRHVYMDVDFEISAYARPNLAPDKELECSKQATITQGTEWHIRIVMRKND